MQGLQHLTCKTMALMSSGAVLHRAPARTPPALAAASAVYFGWENPSSCSSVMQAWRSWSPLSLLCRHPSLCQLRPSSPPPLKFKVSQVGGSLFGKHYTAKLQLMKGHQQPQNCETSFPSQLTLLYACLYPSLWIKYTTFKQKNLCMMTGENPNCTGVFLAFVSWNSQEKHHFRKW